MANMLRNSRKVHDCEWKKYLDAEKVINSKGKTYFEKICTRRAKYLFPLEVKISGIVDNWISIRKFKTIYKFKNIWDIGKFIFIRERGKKDTIRINLSDKTIFNLLGWILAEGHIPKSDRVIQIHQKDMEILNIIKENIKNITSRCSINKGHDAFCLNIISAPLRFLYLDYFGVPPGNKSEIIKIPKSVLETNQENKYVFLAGLEGDMHFSVTKRKNDPFLRPSIGLSLNNSKFIFQFGKLLRELGMYASSSEKKNNDGKMYVSVIGKIRSAVKYFYYIGPYLNSSMHYFKLSIIISQKQMLNSIKVYKGECNDLKNLLIESRDKISDKSIKERYNLLSRLLKDKYNLKVKERTIEAWLFKNSGIPLSFIILSSKLTSTPLTKILPSWISGALYLHNYIPKEELERIRKVKFPPTLRISQVSRALPSWIYSADLSS